MIDITSVSFTSRYDSNLLVTGPWKLNALEESYAAAGFNKRTIHYHCTLGKYGALQAEMHQDHALQTHIAFRSTYNLYYEAVHPNNNISIFVKDSDVYALTPSYYKECSSIIKIFKKMKMKTYGVRDEYQVSGQAAQVLLREIIPQVRVIILHFYLSC